MLHYAGPHFKSPLAKLVFSVFVFFAITIQHYAVQKNGLESSPESNPSPPDVTTHSLV